MNYREQVAENGFCVLKNALSADDVQRMRIALTHHFSTTPCLSGAKLQSYRAAVQPMAFDHIPGTRLLIQNPVIRDAFAEILDGQPYYLHHSDAHINWLSGWHRDSLDKPTYFDFVKRDIWKGETKRHYRVYKAAIYLQNHSNELGLSVKPKSHTARTWDDDGEYQVPTEIGDVIIFDTRLLHRGMTYEELKEAGIFETGENRMSFFFSVGDDGGSATEFANGTIWRQNSQLGRTRYKPDQQLVDTFERSGYSILPHEERPIPHGQSKLYRDHY